MHSLRRALHEHRRVRSARLARAIPEEDSEMKRPSRPRDRTSTPAPAVSRRPRDKDRGDASDPSRPIPPDPGKTTDIEIEEKDAPRRPRRG